MNGKAVEILFDEGILLLGRFGEFSRLPSGLREPARARTILRRLAAMPSVMSRLRSFWLTQSSSHLLINLSDHDLLKMVDGAIMGGQLQAILLPRVPKDKTDGAPANSGPGAISKSQPSGPPSRPIAQWSLEERVAEVIRRAALQVPGDIGKALLSLLTPESLAIVVGTIAVGAAANLTPYGWAADAVIAGIAYGFGGLMAIYALGDLVECFKKTNSAKSDPDLDAAADALAHAVVALGLVGLMAVLHKLRAPKGGASAADAGETAEQATEKDLAEARAQRLKKRWEAQQEKARAEQEAQETQEPRVGATQELRRPYIRNEVRAEVEARAAKTADGKFIDPNTGEPIEGKYDLGHKPGHEFRTEKAKAEAQGLTQEQFNDRMNNPDLYQIESPSSNRSHRFEQKN
jgi:HNH/ENDO VII superfamily nuclease with conserved GHE residues